MKITANKSENIFDLFENKKVRLFELETKVKNIPAVPSIIMFMMGRTHFVMPHLEAFFKSCF